MFAVIGEDESDVEMIKVLIRRIAGDPKIPIRAKGYSGCAQMLIKGAMQIIAFSKVGCRKFVICYDADRGTPEARYRDVVEKIIRPAALDGTFCALVPKQEIEAWILADLSAVTKVIPSWIPAEVFHTPEDCNDPKERLEKISRTAQKRPLYSHAVHNPKVAKYLKLKMVAEKCPSFGPLYDIVKSNIGNYPIPPAHEDPVIYRRSMLNYLAKI